MSNWYVYILSCAKNNSLYVGVTGNLRNRLKSHVEGETRTTRIFGPVKLIYYEAYLNKSDAYIREKFLKSGRGREVMKKQLFYSLQNIKKKDPLK